MKNRLIYLCCVSFLYACSEKGPQPPSIPTLISPINNENCSSGEVVSALESDVTFEWSSTKNTTSYQIEVVNLSNSIKTKISYLEETSKIIRLKRGHIYAWTVTSINEELPEDPSISDNWRFYLKNNGDTNSPPFPIEPVFPSPGQTVELDSSEKIVIEWDTTDVDNDQLTFDFFLAKESSLLNPDQINEGLTTKSIELTLESNQVYFWRVDVSDGNNKTYSQVYSFRTL